MEKRKYLEKFYFLLEDRVKKLDKNKTYALAFSGGIDSSVLAKLLISQKIKFRAYVTGKRKCHDIIQAKIASKELKIRLKIIEIKEKDVKRALPIQMKILKNKNLEECSFNLPIFFVAMNCDENCLISGQGIDEMLGGYKKYARMALKAKKEMKKDTLNLFSQGYKQNKNTVEYFSKNIIFPYLDKNIIKFCLNLPLNLRIRKKKRKYILIKLAEKIKLSKKISEKEKKACQYGSEIFKIVKKINKTQKR